MGTKARYSLVTFSSLGIEGSLQDTCAVSVYVCFYLTSVISSSDLLLLNFVINVRAIPAEATLTLYASKVSNKNRQDARKCVGRVTLGSVI